MLEYFLYLERNVNKLNVSKWETERSQDCREKDRGFEKEL